MNAPPPIQKLPAPVSAASQRARTPAHSKAPSPRLEGVNERAPALSKAPSPVHSKTPTPTHSKAPSPHLGGVNERAPALSQSPSPRLGGVNERTPAPSKAPSPRLGGVLSKNTPQTPNPPSPPAPRQSVTGGTLSATASRVPSSINPRNRWLAEQHQEMCPRTLSPPPKQRTG